MNKEITIFLAFGMSLFSFTFFLSDLSPWETLTIRVVKVGAWFIFCGIIIGFLEARAWYLAVISACLPVLMGLITLINKNAPLDWFEITGYFVLPGPSSTFGGFIGSKIRRFFAKIGPWSS